MFSENSLDSCFAQQTKWQKINKEIMKKMLKQHLLSCLWHAALHINDIHETDLIR